jgi:hypothetical protein
VPRIVARRTVELPLRRTLEVLAIADGAGRIDIWLRARNAAGLEVGMLHSKPSALRSIADALNGVAAELGVAP